MPDTPLYVMLYSVAYLPAEGEDYETVARRLGEALATTVGVVSARPLDAAPLAELQSRLSDRLAGIHRLAADDVDAAFECLGHELPDLLDEAFKRGASIMLVRLSSPATPAAPLSRSPNPPASGDANVPALTPAGEQVAHHLSGAAGAVAANSDLLVEDRRLRLLVVGVAELLGMLATSETETMDEPSWRRLTTIDCLYPIPALELMPGDANQSTIDVKGATQAESER